MNVFMAALAFYLLSLILTLLFCFQAHRDLLWLLSIVSFSAGAALCDDETVSFIMSVLPFILLIFFGYRNRLAYPVSLLYLFIFFMWTNELYMTGFLTVSAASVLLLTYRRFRDDPVKTAAPAAEGAAPIQGTRYNEGKG